MHFSLFFFSPSGQQNAHCLWRIIPSPENEYKRFVRLLACLTPTGSSKGRGEPKPGLESHLHSSRLAAVHSDRTRKRKRKRIVRGHLRTILLGLEARDRELQKWSDHRRYFFAWLSPDNARQAWYGQKHQKNCGVVTSSSDSLHCIAKIWDERNHMWVISVVVYFGRLRNPAVRQCTVAFKTYFITVFGRHFVMHAWRTGYQAPSAPIEVTGTLSKICAVLGKLAISESLANQGKCFL